MMEVIAMRIIRKDDDNADYDDDADNDDVDSGDNESHDDVVTMNY